MNNLSSGVPTLITSGSSLVIGNQGGMEGGEFTVATRISKSMGVVQIRLLLNLTVDSGLRRSSQFSVGEESRYLEHRDGGLYDALVEQGVYEAVCAHEQSHAAAFFTSFVGRFNEQLRSRDVDNVGLDDLVTTVNDAFELAWDLHAEASGAAANEATISWFRQSLEWRCVEHEGGRWVWEKRE